MLQLILLALVPISSQARLKPAVIQLTDPVDHAEGPVWDHRTDTLYYVDIHKGELYAYHIKSDDLRHTNLNGDLSVVVPTRSSKTHFVVGLNRSLVLVEWNGHDLGNTRTLTTVSAEFPRSRFNDGKADTDGRLWFGTMGYESPTGDLEPNQGSLFKFTSTNLKNPDVMIHPVDISNGLAWNKANNKFYYVNTPKRQLYEYDYDAVDGAISNPRVAFDFANYDMDGRPYGMAIDAEDNLWVALYGGGAIIQVDSRSGTRLQMVPIPAQYVTSAAWGGTNYTTLFVTTSRYKLSSDGSGQPGAGSVFAVVNTGTHGYAPNFAEIVNVRDKSAKSNC